MFLAFLVFICTCCQAQTGVVLPFSIDTVETYRIGEQLIRVVRYNMEVKPELRLEVINPIERSLQQAVSIKAFTLDGRVYDFVKSDGVFVESVDVSEKQVKIVFEYNIPKSKALLAECVVPILSGRLDVMACTKRN